MTRLRQLLPLGCNAVQHADHHPQLRQTAQPTAHCQLSCVRLVTWSAGGGHQQVDRLHVFVGQCLADPGCQVLELQDRGFSRERRGHRDRRRRSSTKIDIRSAATGLRRLQTANATRRKPRPSMLKKT